jgi:hypothetical protein
VEKEKNHLLCKGSSCSMETGLTLPNCDPASRIATLSRSACEVRPLPLSGGVETTGNPVEPMILSAGWVLPAVFAAGVVGVEVVEDDLDLLENRFIAGLSTGMRQFYSPRVGRRKSAEGRRSSGFPGQRLVTSLSIVSPMANLICEDKFRRNTPGDGGKDDKVHGDTLRIIIRWLIISFDKL